MKYLSWIVGIGLLLGPVPPALAISAPFLDVLIPENGEVWETGSTHTITWDNGGFELVDIAYTTTGSDNGPWFIIANDVNAHTERYNWIVPSTPTSTGLIRLRGHFSYPGPVRYEYGDGTFSIVNPMPSPMLKVVQPNGGEVWRIGTRQPIRWESASINTQALLRIEIDRGGAKWKTIGWSPNTGNWVWRVTGPKTDAALVRISFVSNPPVSDVSDSSFRIVNR